jgi:hypothetical protein
MINSRPVPVTYPIDGPSASARLDRAKAHTRALSSSIKSVTNNAMGSVGAKGCGYSALTNGSTSVMQPSKPEKDKTPHEMKELLPRGTPRPTAASPAREALRLQPPVARRKSDRFQPHQVGFGEEKREIDTEHRGIRSICKSRRAASVSDTSSKEEGRSPAHVARP